MQYLAEQNLHFSLYVCAVFFFSFLYLLCKPHRERPLLLLLPRPKTLFLERYYFHPRVCVCLCVCVRVYIDYLKKFLTDFNETGQEDLLGNAGSI